MFGSAVLDVAIGLVTIYLSFALACTAVVEAIASWFAFRSKNLEAAMRELLACKGDRDALFNRFFKHPLVASLSKGDDGRPSYLPPELVSRVMVSLLHEKSKGKPGAADGASLEELIEHLPEGRARSMLVEFAHAAQNDVEAFRRQFERQFDFVMDRARGWFKRRQQYVTLAISALLVVVANADTIAITRSLSNNGEARAALVKSAEEALQGLPDSSQEPSADELHTSRRKLDAAQERVTAALRSVEATGIPLGWSSPPGLRGIVLKLFGLAVTVFAVSLGAPFWFDTLNRFMQVRTSFAPAEPEPKKPARKKPAVKKPAAKK